VASRVTVDEGPHSHQNVRSSRGGRAPLGMQHAIEVTSSRLVQTSDLVVAVRALWLGHTASGQDRAEFANPAEGELGLPRVV
jgi:hypothetical protein